MSTVKSTLLASAGSTSTFRSEKAPGGGGQGPAVVSTGQFGPMVTAPDSVPRGPWVDGSVGLFLPPHASTTSSGSRMAARFTPPILLGRKNELVPLGILEERRGAPRLRLRLLDELDPLRLQLLERLLHVVGFKRA